MGEGTAGTVREIQQIRSRLDGELDALQDSLPPTEDIAQKAAAIVGGLVAAVLALWLLGRRMRTNREDERVKRLVREAMDERDAAR